MTPNTTKAKHLIQENVCLKDLIGQIEDSNPLSITFLNLSIKHKSICTHTGFSNIRIETLL
jgi:hypothetical protein